MAEPSATERDLIEKLADSFMTSYRAGQRPSVDGYVQQYPELADQLRGLITALIVLEQNAPHRNRPDVLPKPAGEAAAPREIGEFSIVREIGRGGMGVVYEAVQQSLGRHVALKVLSSPSLMNPVHLERFRLEARSAGRLHHSHIVPVFGVGEHQGLHYYAMQFIPGQSLDQVIDELRALRPGGDADKKAPAVQNELTQSLAGGLLTGRFRADEPASPDGRVNTAPVESESGVSDDTPRVAARESTNASLAVHSEFSSGSSGRPFYESVARVGLQVAEALAYAHAEGILHRDIKPSNLLLDAKGNTWVTDFGLAKAEENQPLTETGDFVGTLRYMAPERLEGWSDRRSDIYGLGVTLYELLTLHPLFESGSRARLIDSIRHAQPQAPTKVDPAIPRDLETIVLKSLAKEPASRYHTAEAMAEDLRRYLADRPILGRRSTTRERFVRWCRHNPAVATLTATVALALVAGTVVSTTQAIRATRAETLAEARLSAETEARRVADNAGAAEAAQRKAAETERTEAEKQRAAAEANYQKAKAAVDKYFTLVSESMLLDVPGLQPLRKDLLEAALEFYEGAALQRTSDPAVLVDVALTHLRVGSMYFALNRLDDLFDAMDRALDVVDRLRRDHPHAGDHERKLAGWYKGARMTRDHLDLQRDPLSAYRTLLRFLATWERLAVEHPAEPGFQSDLMGAQIVMAMGLSAVGRKKEALAYMRKARAGGEKLVAQYPQVPLYRATLGNVCWRMALPYFSVAADQADERMAWTRRAMELYEGLVVEFPDVPAYREGLASSLSGLGDQIAKTEPRQAEELHRRALDLRESLLREFPSESLYWEAWRDDWAAWVVFEASRGNDSQANQHVRKVIETFEAQIKVRPQDRWLREELANFCQTIAAELRRQGNLTALAEQLNRQAMALMTELVDEFPGDRRLIRLLAEFHGYTAGDLWGRGRMDEAAEHFKAAVAVMEIARRQQPEWLYIVRLLADRTIDLARIMAYGARTTDPAATCRLCLRASQILDESLQKDPIRRSFLAVVVWAYGERLLKEPERLPEAEQMMTWSRPIVEQTIKDIALLDKLTADPAAHQGDRHIAAETQKWLAKILTWTSRAAQAQEMWVRAIRSYKAIANDHPDQQIHVRNALQDYRQQSGARVEQLVKNGQPDEAVKLHRNAIDAIDKMAAEHPKHDDPYRAFQAESFGDLAQVLADGGHAQEAEQAHRRAVELADALVVEFPGQPLSWRNWIGWAWFKARNSNDPDDMEIMRKLIETSEAQVKEHPQDRTARTKLASLCLTVGDRAFRRENDAATAERLQRRAQVLFHELADEFPADAGYLEHVGWSCRFLGEIARGAGRLDEAREHYEAAADAWGKLAANKTIPQRDGWYRNWEADTLIQLAYLQPSGAHAQQAITPARHAVETCQALVSDFPGNVDYQQRMGWGVRVLAQRLVAAGQLQQSVEACRQHVAFCKKLQHDHPQVDFNPELASAHLTLSFSLAKSGQVEEATQAWEKAIAIAPLDANTLNDVAWSLAEEETAESAAALAVQVAKQATKAAPDGAYCWNTLGVAQYRAGQWEDAIASLAKAEELAPERSLVFNGLFLAMTHHRMGHKDEARKWYDKAVGWMERNQPKNEKLVRFRSEAEKVLGITQPSPTPKDAPQGDTAKPNS